MQGRMQGELQAVPSKHLPGVEWEVPPASAVWGSLQSLRRD